MSERKVHIAAACGRTFCGRSYRWGNFVELRLASPKRPPTCRACLAAFEKAVAA